MQFSHMTDLTPPEAFFLAIIVAAVLTSYVIGRWGQSKGKSFWEGFLLSLFVTPTVGALVVGLTPPRTGLSMAGRDT
ncbi:MAG: hypothetical protein V4671_27920 [Armatimonadota bacterium]